MMAEYYSRAGEPIGHDDWLREWSGENKRVAVTDVGDACVSTVYLGMNHAWAGGPPLIFETMIFDGDHDGWCWRYGSEERAQEGHAAVVAALERGDSPESIRGDE